jgi:hypothetical protein
MEAAPHAVGRSIKLRPMKRNAIGRTIDGKKKRFWLGNDRAEAQRKAWW